MILDDDGDDELDADEDDAFPVGPAMMWLMYAECGVCGAAEAAACVGQRFGPHGGRPTRRARDLAGLRVLEERVRAEFDAAAVRVAASGWVPPADEHGLRGGVKWRVSEPGVEPAVFEGGCLCHCGELFVRTAALGGMPAAERALFVHQGGQVAA